MEDDMTQTFLIWMCRTFNFEIDGHVLLISVVFPARNPKDGSN